MARLVYLGTPEAAVPPLEALVHAGHDVALVVSRPDTRRGRGTARTASPVAAAARGLGLEVTDRLQDAVDVGAELGVVVAYGRIVPAPVLDAVPMVNVHFSLLPRWRGAAPVERALLAGDGETGVTIHETVAALDAGPIAAQEAFPIGPGDDAGAVYRLAAPLAVSLLEAVLARPTFTPQPEDGVTYAEKITASDRELDLDDPVDADRRVRALAPHIGARARLGGRDVIVWRAHLSDGRFVPDEVQPAGGRRMSYAAFRRGLRG